MIQSPYKLPKCAIYSHSQLQLMLNSIKENLEFPTSNYDFIVAFRCE